VTVITAANLRRLIPVGAVAAVLAFSSFASVPSFASNGGTGYNCGVKGIGYHDHGKVCPNRPFPGMGEGLEKFGINVTTTARGHAKDSEVLSTTTNTTSTSEGDGDSTTLSETGDTTPLGRSHSHAGAHSHSHGR
jgi:hypothetical protein